MPVSVTGAPTKGIKNLCDQLGEPYVLSVIDGENVIYRNLGNGYDIEISGADHNRKKHKSHGLCLEFTAARSC